MRNTRNWKHVTKNRKQYRPIDIYENELVIPFISEYIFKKNTPFMNEDKEVEIYE